MYIMCQVEPYYTLNVILAAYYSSDAGTLTRDEFTLARFCAQIAQIEKCYSSRLKTTNQN